MKLLSTLLDLLLPRTGRSMRVSAHAQQLRWALCEEQLCGRSVTTLLDYRDGAVRDAIQSLKYDGSADAARLLAGVLREFLSEEIADVRLFSAAPIVLVPIPLHPDRERERGFNQIERVLSRLPTTYRDGSTCTIALRSLARTKYARPQTALSREERLSNVAGAFDARGADLAGARVVLIDDVVTTGATLSEAADELESAGAHAVLPLALARA